MNVQFIAPNPRQTASPILDTILRAGKDQLAIACAFLAPGGVEVLRPHAARLSLPPSFVVVAWDYPTSLDALNELHSLMPGKVYVHLGSLTPVEKGVGPGLMHSKVFFVRHERRCWMWTGSHNLTASATQGVNCEAAVLIEGTIDDTIFADVLDHLNQCRSEAMLFDPRNPPPPISPEQTLVVHAECHAALKNPPWFVHIRPATIDYDKAMRPPAAVWLYLYEPGSLRPDQPRPKAKVAYSGTLTALNFTEQHPQYTGISADWREADYVIEIERGVPRLTEPTPHTATPSQGVFRIEAEEKPETVWLIESPVPKLERVVGVERIAPIDSKFRRFFTKQSLVYDGLLHQEYRTLSDVTRTSRKEVGSLEATELRERLGMPNQTQLLIQALDAGDIFEFIYRAKYRA